MRRLSPALGAAILLAGCGAAGPMPTLEDYSLGLSTPVQAGSEYFFEDGKGGGAAVPAALGNGEGAGSLADLSRRWRSACLTRCASGYRIIDLRKKSSSKVTL